MLGEWAEPPTAQPIGDPLEEQAVLEHPAAERHLGETGPLGDPGRHLHQDAAESAMKTGGDHGGRNTQ
jgi:hypothetical protein